MTVLNEKLLGVNEEGFEWYLNIGLTKHLHEDKLSVDGEIIGKKLRDNLVAIRIQKEKKTISYIIFDKEKKEIVYDCGGFEACAAKIDLLKLLNCKEDEV